MPKTYEISPNLVTLVGTKNKVLIIGQLTLRNSILTASPWTSMTLAGQQWEMSCMMPFASAWALNDMYWKMEEIKIFLNDMYWKMEEIKIFSEFVDHLECEKSIFHLLTQPYKCKLCLFLSLVLGMALTVISFVWCFHHQHDSHYPIIKFHKSW